MRGNEFPSIRLDEAEYRATMAPIQSDILAGSYDSLAPFHARKDRIPTHTGLPEITSSEVLYRSDILAPEWRPQVHLAPEYDQLPGIGVAEREQAEDTLRSNIAIRMRRAGLRPSIVTNVYATYDKQKPEQLAPQRVEIALEHGPYRMEATISVDLGFVELDERSGEEREWDARVYIEPFRLQVDGEDFPVHPLMAQLGYQILVNGAENFSSDETIDARIDSICLTGMIDKHKASAGGNRVLGCDCADQRDKGKDLVHKNGGLSVLTYAEGRLNGLRVHFAQIEEQGFRHENGMSRVDTYEAHENQGVPGDSRDPYYPFDVLLLSAAWRIRRLRIGTNNPEKIAAAAQQMDFVERVAVHGNDDEYNKGFNKQAKIAAGHME